MDSGVIFLICLFVFHWFCSLFFQTFFLHRYASHQMFTMNKFWERFFYFGTFMAQGTSFLNARAYAYMHRAHHAFSDTENDPHSPHYYKNVVTMMIQTAKIYYGYVKKEFPITKETKGYVPEWKSLEELGDTWGFRIGWIVFYSAIYLYFLPPDYWWVALIAVPMHSLMGPMHGAIVNWCGHKYGYSNFDNKDYSKNTLLMDFLMMGELYQNNHHTYPRRLNFAVKWWEFDPTYWITKVLKKLHIIKLST